MDGEKAGVKSSQNANPPPATPWSRARHAFTRSIPGTVGLAVCALMILACVASMPWTMGAAARGDAPGSPRYDVQYRTARHLPPSWWGADPAEPGDSAAAR